MKKTIEWNNLTFIIEDDGITVFDHNVRKEPKPEDKYTIPQERSKQLLEALFNVFQEQRWRNDEVMWTLTFIMENPILIMFPPARYRKTHQPTKGES